MQKKIVFTGGGTGGHVYPGLAVIEELKRINSDLDIFWLGTKSGMEYSIVKNAGIRFVSIPSGKLRRYFSLKNFTDVFQIIAAIVKSLFILSKEKPQLLFSKGGFVSVPPVIAAKILRIPVYMHESDFTPGLASRINSRFATKIFVPYEETVKYFPQKENVLVSGNPVRKDIRIPSVEFDDNFVKLSKSKLLLLVLGGSLGAEQINQLIYKHLDYLKKHFIIVHQTGKGKKQIESHENYYSFEYINEELPSLLHHADIVVSRAGAGTLWENLFTKTPALLIPLGLHQSRGDQIINAEYFEKHGYAKSLSSENLDSQFELEIKKIVENNNTLAELKQNIEKSVIINAVDIISTNIFKEINNGT